MSKSSKVRGNSPRTILLTACLAILATVSSASAHFLWISAEPGMKGSGVVHAFLSEQDVPDLPMFLRTIAAATYSADGEPLSAIRGEETYLVQLPEDRPRVVDGECDLGVMTKGGATFRLMYTARAQFELLPAETVEQGKGLRVLLVTEDAGLPVALVRFEGEPAAGAVVRVTLDDGEEHERIADDRGRVECLEAAKGRVALLAKWTDGVAGERGGKPFDESRHYATLTVTPPTVDEGTPAVPETPRPDPPFALIPEPINSFGGAVLGSHLYIYSGHTGTTHRYHTGTTNPHFYRIDLTDRSSWEELPCATSLQGVALVSDGLKLYRVGGMAARNAEGEPHDLISVDEVACFDPETRSWTDLPPLPEPRSTHDAAVLGDHLYVVGGWSMTGGDADGAYFLDDVVRLDLKHPEEGWESLPAPSTPRRALALAAYGGKLYAVGGLLETSKTVTTVEVFDPQEGTWSGGPELPGAAIQGFAPSAFSVGGRLLASGGDGILYRLSTPGDAWEAIGKQAVPRITHRLLPGIDQDVLIVGGNFAGVPVRFVESIPLDESAGDHQAMPWTTELPGEAVQSQAVGVVGSRLVIAGGNRSAAPHDFEADNLTAETFSIRLDGSAAEPIGALPEPRQSGVVVAFPRGRQVDTYVLGGLGQDGEVVRSLGTIDRKTASESTWERLDATIPDARGMFGAAVYDDSIWVFGGSRYDPRPDSEARGFPVEVLRWQPDSEGSTFEVTEHRIPRPRRSFAGAVFDGKYYMVGGLGEDQGLVKEVDVFDFETGRWEQIPTPRQPRVFADLAVLDGKLYMAGGFAPGAAGHFEPARSIEVYDPASQSWSIAMEEVPIDAKGIRLGSVQGRLVVFGINPEDPRHARLALIAPQPGFPQLLQANRGATGGTASEGPAQEETTR